MIPLLYQLSYTANEGRIVVTRTSTVKAGRLDSAPHASIRSAATWGTPRVVAT